MIDNNSQQLMVCKKFPVLSAGEQAFIEHFFKSGSIARIPARQYICREGDECSHLALLISGRVRVYKLAENGKEITLYRIKPGDSCVLTASCIMSEVNFPALAVAETDLEAVLVPAMWVRSWMGTSEVWRRLVFGLISKRLADVISVLENVAFQRMDVRIAAYLLGQPRSRRDEVETTHQIVAAELGTSREVVSRILKDFEAKGLIYRSRGMIRILNLAALGRKAENR